MFGGRIMVIMTVVSVVCFILTGVFGWQYYRATRTASQPANSTAAIIKHVAKQYPLPQGETPRSSQIQNAQKLKSQTFFKDVQDGDTLLLYPKHSLAIIYRSSTGKLIQAGPANITLTN